MHLYPIASEHDHTALRKSYLLDPLLGTLVLLPNQIPRTLPITVNMTGVRRCGHAAAAAAATTTLRQFPLTSSTFLLTSSCHVLVPMHKVVLTMLLSFCRHESSHYQQETQMICPTRYNHLMSLPWNTKRKKPCQGTTMTVLSPCGAVKV